MERKWWHSLTAYQVYPRSFYDSNGDGIGDIKGITQKLDYLKELGIGIIWLSPVYKSPNDDNGYDISDYYDIMDEFGTMADMEELIAEAAKRGIRIVMDLVVNHTSDEHKWFVEARASKNSRYRDYYIWADPVNGGPPTDMPSSWSDSAWEYDKESGQYYFHMFSVKQADLNWENPDMRSDIYDMMNFWIDKGIGGFRMDVIEMIGKKPFEGIINNGPMLHEYLREMNERTFGAHDLLTVGECWNADTEIAKLYSAPERHELSMVFQFEHICLKGDKWYPKPYRVRDLKRVFSKWQKALHNKGWNSLFWCNHDLPRAVSAFGNDKEYREESAKMLATLLHGMQGTPYIYQGEELGMTNIRLGSIEDYRDIESINMYNDRIAKGDKEEDIMESIYQSGRDNARTPMQWSAEQYGGFSKVQPWISVNENYREINAAAQINDETSVFSHYKRLVALRRSSDTIVYGDFRLVNESDDDFFAYERSYNGETILVVCNMTPENREFVYRGAAGSELLIGSRQDADISDGSIKLRPYEALILKLA